MMMMMMMMMMEGPGRGGGGSKTGNALAFHPGGVAMRHAI